MIIEFSWLSKPEVGGVLNMVYTVINIIRIVVPIVLIVMTTIDITKKIIDPSEKEGQKRIMIRLVAAVIVFLLPTIINISFRLLGIDTNTNIDRNTSLVTPTVKPIVTMTPISTPVPTFTPTPTSSLLNKLNITNCPDLSNNFKVGDKITLKTDIPSTFDGKINWTIDDASAVKVTYNNNNKEAILDIIDQPRLATVWVTLTAGRQVSSCYFHIIAVDNLEIINCPNDNQIYHVGDKFILQSNLPTYYKSFYNWGSSTSPNTFKFTPSEDGRQCHVEILEVPKEKYAYIGFGADSKSTSCKINIE